MKKFFFLLAVLPLLFSGCSKSDDDPTPTTYTLRYEFGENSAIVDLTLFEYNSKGESININSLKNCTFGTTRTFEAMESTEKVKVYIKMYIGSVSRYLWVQQVFYLNKKANLDIHITGTTTTGSQEP